MKSRRSPGSGVRIVRILVLLQRRRGPTAASAAYSAAAAGRARAEWRWPWSPPNRPVEARLHPQARRPLPGPLPLPDRAPSDIDRELGRSILISVGLDLAGFFATVRLIPATPVVPRRNLFDATSTRRECLGGP
ncbi:hypothetical protein NL676_035631 [Syzygium grande]|nr:hypothetical protein NL676_035631 [Syzygium grande]